jgi:hypothetical protein
MFKKPKANIIESDEGFSVETLGRTGLKYVQNGKTLFIDSEILMGHADMMIDTKSIIKWETGELIDDNSKKIIIDNIRRAFNFDGAEIDFR